jgi:hypothetical protein
MEGVSTGGRTPLDSGRKGILDPGSGMISSLKTKPGIRMSAPDKSRLMKEALSSSFSRSLYLGAADPAVPSIEHLLKSISCLHPGQMCCLLNSSEKISFSFPQPGHLHTKELKFLKFSYPGQCAGVFILSSL